MKTRPILFSASMVRALLAGRKTQTRRVLKWPAWVKDHAWAGETIAAGRAIGRGGAGNVLVPRIKIMSLATCPYGQPGDRLWVRETWGIISLKHSDGISDDDVLHFEDDHGVDRCVLFAATAPAGFEWNDQPESKWRPSIFMPRWASRITLEIESVRVERAQDISESDACAEGVLPRHAGNDERTKIETHRTGFAALWDSINGNSAWLRNDFVWAITFRRLLDGREHSEFPGGAS